MALWIAGALFFNLSRQTVALAKSSAAPVNEAYNGRVFYEIFVRSFNDSNGDGIGDLKGVTEKLDYLKALGIRGIWLMPINASPSYHGYDISDYLAINKDYGTLQDFEQLIQEAHKRDIKVEMDMVINHTSTDHPWFKAAVADPTSPYRSYYCWTKDADMAKESSPISAQPWTPLGSAGEYYYSIFWSGMPDLNYDNPSVREEMKQIAKFYLVMGVDGFRLDAAMWIYTDNEEKNLAWWKEYNDYIKSINKNAILVGEVWQDSTKKIAPYYKALDSCFNFPLADAIVTGVNGEAISDAMTTARVAYDRYQSISPNYIDSPFLTNHDMNRSMDSFHSIEKAKHAAAILLTLPGTPYVYYGEETGMTGSKPDELIRQPFLWDNKKLSLNTSWEKSENNANSIAVSVEQKNKTSLLNFYKTMIQLRNHDAALRLGSFKLIDTISGSVAAYKRIYGKEQVYIYVNVGSDKAAEAIDLKKAAVLYTNKKHTGTMTFKGSISLTPYEITILKNSSK